MPEFELTPQYEAKRDAIVVARLEAARLIVFLNEKTGRNFKPTEVNTRFLEARFKEGATIQEVKQVIALKVRQWRDDPVMRQYLRPATLFNKTRYWQYHGELGDG